MSHLKLSMTCAGTAGTALAVVLAAGLFSPSARPADAAPPSTTLVAAALPAQAQGGAYGVIKGRLVWGGKDVPKAALIKPSKDVEVCSKEPIQDRSLVVDPTSKGVSHSFAYIVNPKGKNAEAAKALVQEHPSVEIDQKSCEYLPYSTALLADQKVVFKSSDPVSHNVHYIGFANGSKNFTLPPNGQSESTLKPDRRPISLKCDIHPWMQGWIMVFDHPFFAVTKEDGSFEIHGVPAGTQNLVLWQEAAGYVNQGAARGMPVQVKAGQTTDVGEIVLDPSKVKK